MPPLQQHTYHRSRLTGKTRLRRQWLTGCLVQQVQEVHEERIGHTTPAPPPQRGETWAHRLWRLASHRAQEAESWAAKRYTWRDATESDMAAMHELPAQLLKTPGAHMVQALSGRCATLHRKDIPTDPNPTGA